MTTLTSFPRPYPQPVIDKTGWPEGPWDSEPNSMFWLCDGLPCVIYRVHGGWLCGYVGVAINSPWVTGLFDKNQLEVHGGITYEKEASGYFWLGFDCAHSGDAYPRLKDTSEIYRTFNYVFEQVLNLVKQINQTPAPAFPPGLHTISPEGLYRLRALAEADYIEQDKLRAILSHITTQEQAP